jgi:AcrR family transcriptional regulator
VFLESGFATGSIREIATQAGVSIPTVELLFRTKTQLLKSAIDVAIAGDDDTPGVLERAWTVDASSARNARDLLAIFASVITPAQQRSAGLVLAVFEGARTETELAALAEQLVKQRARTAAWIVDRLATVATLRPEQSHQQAIDSLWMLMDSAVFDRLTRQLGWSSQQYMQWFADAAHRLLVNEQAQPKTKPVRRTP